MGLGLRKAPGGFQTRLYRGMCLWVVMGEGWFANRPYGGWCGRWRGGDGLPPSREQRVRVGMAPLGWQRGDVGRVRRAPTRDAPTGDWVPGCRGGRVGFKPAPTGEGGMAGEGCWGSKGRGTPLPGMAGVWGRDSSRDRNGGWGNKGRPYGGLGLRGAGRVSDGGWGL